jgi:uncharacterized protein (TIGR03435 family)
MLQALLADRFHLIAHRETVTMPVYRLTRRAGGELKDGNDAASPSITRTPDGYRFENSDLVRLASFLGGQLDRPVVDGTGLTGVYTFTLTSSDPPSSDPIAKREGVSPDSPSSGAFADGLRRLGLQLVSARGPVEYLVVDQVEQLSDN